MPDNNAAIVLILFLVFVVIGLAAFWARKSIKSFTFAMVRAKQAGPESSV